MFFVFYKNWGWISKGESDLGRCLKVSFLKFLILWFVLWVIVILSFRFLILLKFVVYIVSWRLGNEANKYNVNFMSRGIKYLL